MLGNVGQAFAQVADDLIQQVGRVLEHGTIVDERRVERAIGALATGVIQPGRVIIWRGLGWRVLGGGIWIRWAAGAERLRSGR